MSGLQLHRVRDLVSPPRGVVHFERATVSGHVFRRAARAATLVRFSGCDGWSQRLKPLVSRAAHLISRVLCKSGDFIFFGFYGTVNVIVWLLVSLPDVPVTVMV